MATELDNVERSDVELMGRGRLSEPWRFDGQELHTCPREFLCHQDAASSPIAAGGAATLAVSVAMRSAPGGLFPRHVRLFALQR